VFYTSEDGTPSRTNDSARCTIDRYWRGARGEWSDRSDNTLVSGSLGNIVLRRMDVIWIAYVGC